MGGGEFWRKTTKDWVVIYLVHREVSGEHEDQGQQSQDLQQHVVVGGVLDGQKECQTHLTAKVGWQNFGEKQQKTAAQHFSGQQVGLLLLWIVFVLVWTGSKDGISFEAGWETNMCFSRFAKSAMMA